MLLLEMSWSYYDVSRRIVMLLEMPMSYDGAAGKVKVIWWCWWKYQGHMVVLSEGQCHIVVCLERSRS